MAGAVCCRAERVHQYVEARAGGDRPRHGQRQQRVQRNPLRAAAMASHHVLASGLVLDQRRDGALAAGAGGGRHRGKRRHGPGQRGVAALQEVGQRRVAGQHGGEYLADIDHAAAAERDQPIAVVLAPAPRGRMDMSCRRVRGDIVVTYRIDAGPAQVVRDAGEQPRGRQSRIAEQQRAVHALTAGPLRQPIHAPRAEHRLAGPARAEVSWRRAEEGGGGHWHGVAHQIFRPMRSQCGARSRFLKTLPMLSRGNASWNSTWRGTL